MQVDESAVVEPAIVEPAVTVKGWRNGLLLILPPEGAWDDVMLQVDARLDEAKARSFWRGAQTTIDCAMRHVSFDQLSQLVDRTKRAYGLVPIAVVATEAETRAAGEKLALTPYAEMPIIKKPPRDGVAVTEAAVPSGVMPVVASSGVPANASNALYLPTTVRSGQRVVHEGHIVIGGDVNAGAEVIAAGDVLIFGTLRGLAHAGSNGDEAARIVANSLRPQQLRIAGKIARAPEESKQKSSGASPKAGAEVARIENGEIQVFPL